MATTGECTAYGWAICPPTSGWAILWIEIMEMSGASLLCKDSILEQFLLLGSTGMLSSFLELFPCTAMSVGGPLARMGSLVQAQDLLHLSSTILSVCRKWWRKRFPRATRESSCPVFRSEVTGAGRAKPNSSSTVFLWWVCIAYEGTWGTDTSLVSQILEEDGGQSEVGSSTPTDTCCREVCRHGKNSVF